VIIELRLWPDDNRQINHLPAARGFGEGQLEPGMVSTCTSALGLAFSETVFVTDAGAERLTRTERVLFVR
jgi:hypothetical protein